VIVCGSRSTCILTVKWCRVPAVHGKWDSAERLLQWDSRMSRQCGSGIVIVMMLVSAVVEDQDPIAVPAIHPCLSSVARSKVTSSMPPGL
jgi:hypothetical protein